MYKMCYKKKKKKKRKIKCRLYICAGLGKYMDNKFYLHKNCRQHQKCIIWIKIIKPNDKKKKVFIMGRYTVGILKLQLILKSNPCE